MRIKYGYRSDLQIANKVRVSLAIDEALVARAKAAGVNLSAVAGEAIRFRTRKEEMRQWS